VEDKKFPKGSVILKEGDDVEAALYLVREGKVKITSNDDSTGNIIGDGAYFGEVMLSLDVQYASEAVEKGRVNGDSLSSEYLLQKPTTTKNPYTVTVEEDVVCGVLTLKACRGIFDTSSFGRGKKRLPSFTASVIEGKIDFDDLQKHVMLGTGTFGQVWLVSMRSGIEKTGAYALKIQSKVELIQAHQAKGVVQEMTIMKQLNHPLLLRLVKTFQDDDMVYMMLGLVQGGELFNRIHSSLFDGVPEEAAKFYAAGVYEAMAYMHRRQIIYRDLKPGRCHFA
jgi:serine/threonine protein kinase